MSQRALVIGLIAVLSSAPLVAATWSSRGDYEPSTHEDTAGGFMWNQPFDTGNHVYFNGYLSQDPAGATVVNPNVAAGQTEIAGAAFVFQAILGVWADCNHDGYIGLSESGLTEYRVEVLNAQVPLAQQSPECRPHPDVPTTTAGHAAWHNDGTWVREYVPISWSPADGQDADGLQNGYIVDDNIYNVDDNASRVWVDYQLGGDDGGHGGCLVNPQVGSLQSTGGFLEWADCGTGKAIIGAINMVSDLSCAKAVKCGLGFGDSPNDEWHSNGLLNVWNPYGQQSDPSYVDAWDCSSGSHQQFTPRDPTAPPGTHGQLWRVPDPTYTSDSPGSGKLGDHNGHVNVTRDDGFFVYDANVSATRSTPGTNAPVLTADGLTKPGHPSPSGTVNATLSGTDKCNRNTDAAHPDRANTLANEPYAAEAGYAAAGVRVKVDDWLHPTNAVRHANQSAVTVWDPTAPDANNDGQPDGKLVDQTIPEPLGHAGGQTTEGSLGVAMVDVPFDSSRFDPASNADGIWTGGFQHLVEGPGYDSNNAKTMGIVNATYYAYVTPTGLDVKATTPSIYGGNDENTGTPKECGSHILTTASHAPTDANVWNNWDCNTGEWYRDGAGSEKSTAPIRSAFLGCDRNNPGPNQNDATLCVKVLFAGTVGDLYNLKDFDCWDMSAAGARGAGVSTGPIGWWNQLGNKAACSKP